jgi:TonB-linked SusC/RagA family outer membrane protein
LLCQTSLILTFAFKETQYLSKMFIKSNRLVPTVIFLVGVFFSTSLRAQEHIVEGRITSAYDNFPVEGVHIRVSDLPDDVVSDADGYFIMSAAEGAKLAFYYGVGPLDSLTVSGNQFHNIRLKVEGRTTPDYERTSIRTSAAASGATQHHQFNHGVIAGPEQLVQGRIAGLQTTSASGDPAAFTYSLLRGAGSLYGNQPLVVLDGVPINMNRFSPPGADLGFGVAQDRNPLRFINSSDIQKVEVLKDGSNAMYGSRGGNGVIFITTRAAAYKRKQFEYSSQVSIVAMRKRMNLLGPMGFLRNYQALGGDMTQVDFGNHSDWQSVVLRPATSHKHDLAFSDQYENGQLRASVGYEDQQGLVEHSSMKRISARLNLQHAWLQERLAVNAKLLFSHVTDEVAPITIGQNNVIASMISTNPTVSPELSEGAFNGIRPTAWLNYTRDNTVSNVYWSLLSATYNLDENFKLKVNTNIDGSASKRENAYSSLLNTTGSQRPGIATIQQLDVTNIFVEGNLTYDKKLANGSFNALLGFSDQHFQNETSNLTGAGFQSTNPSTMTNALGTAGNMLTNALPGSYFNFGYDNTTFFASSLETMTVKTYPAPANVPVSAVVGSQREINNAIQSLFVRLGYEHLKKYFFTAGLRRDASNRFGKDHAAGYFPYGTFAWKISGEDFFGDNGIYLKARVSYGSAGNANLQTNQNRRQFLFSDVRVSNNGNVQQPGLISSPGNPDLHWETVNQTNLGIDFSFANGKLGGTLDVYNKITHNMLAYVATAQPSVGSQILLNTDAEVVNKGLEISLNAQLLQQKNASLAVGMVFSYNANKVKSWRGVVDLSQVYGQGFSGAYTQQVKEGGKMYEYFLRQFNGFDQNGFDIYANGGIQRSLNKTPIPSVNSGFSIEASYRRFYLSTLLTAQFGHYLYNNTANSLLVKGSLANGKNVTAEVAASKEAPYNEAGVSSRFLEKANFVRLQELVAGYRFVFSGSKIDQLEISAVAQNLFVFTGYSGFDPEVNVSTGSSANAVYGTDYTAYPRPRMFTLRIGILF